MTPPATPETPARAKFNEEWELRAAAYARQCMTDPAADPTEFALWAAANYAPAWSPEERAAWDPPGEHDNE